VQLGTLDPTVFTFEINLAITAPEGDRWSGIPCAGKRSSWSKISVAMLLSRRTARDDVQATRPPIRRRGVDLLHERRRLHEPMR
jgi:hypothetical protein